MKGFYLAASVILTVLILIIAFGNIGAQMSFVNILFWEVPTGLSPTILFLAISFLGLITGVFYGAFFRALTASDEDEEDF